MKKLLSIALIVISMVTYAQTEKESYFSLSSKFDVKNAIVGSEPTNNKSALDLHLNANMVKNNFELSMGYETFHTIGFEKYSVDFGWHFPRYIPIFNKEIDITIVPSIGFSMINRYDLGIKSITGETLNRMGFVAIQGNLSFRVPLTDTILLDYTIEAQGRPDREFLYPETTKSSVIFSNLVGIHYKF